MRKDIEAHRAYAAFRDEDNVGEMTRPRKTSSRLWMLTALCLAVVGALVLWPPPLGTRTATMASTTTTRTTVEQDVDVGEAVDLTTFLPDRVQEGRDACRVPNDVLGGEDSWACLATVNETAQNKLFWWFVPPVNEAAKAQRKKAAPELEPMTIILWLQGGPGSSSLFGMFGEMGPFGLGPDLQLSPREWTWARKYGMLFVDNPAGTGFSVAEKGEYCDNTREQVSQQLVSLLRSFYTTFPELRKGKLVVAGESYGGHYTMGLSALLAKQDFVPFLGVSAGNAWIDPVHHVPRYPDVMYNLGIISAVERARIEDYTARATALIKAGRMSEAFTVWDAMINGDLLGAPSYFANVTGLTDYFNYMRMEEPPSEDLFGKFVDQPHVRKGIHVGSIPFGAHSRDVEMALRGDFMVSFRPEVEALLEASVPVLIYNGMLDVIIHPVLTAGMLERLEFPDAASYRAEPQRIWKDKKGVVAGYWKHAGSLTSVVLRGAGHMVPADQPEHAFHLIDTFIERASAAVQDN
ncbi:Vitellogenic carboxypeptidase [Hondaea fermentalgiana]|uniref:Carboxypeptidase n=1 Tax=Hondaea fermentalgiana TaxID=2315210 RepID=A0A2R5H0H3_9STRA|nr:Vitellogenic carboxypeptidase [Hondaea fermentalgiana]|eukprot:GBG33814.1 Vitellogenic carboxypeptidase [Hondaea fermentalgiana]